uniref:NADH dehydrogenase subunit 6 n=1 Tax=Bemisia tabaci TaxID=7038 RepID=A0A7S7YG94_BEMTA|nr:NADH dehydrogenase subunit 6 [Bemisia tabaci]
MIYWLKLLTFLFLFTMFDPLMLVLFFILALGFSSILLVFIINSYFYGFMLFMLFMSGIVILLAYMCGVIIIEKVSSIYKFYLTFIWILILISLFTQFIKFDFIYFHIFIMALKINYYEFYFMFKFMLFPFNLVSIFFIFYLLLCLVIIYEIIKKCSGPLRMKI